MHGAMVLYDGDLGFLFQEGHYYFLYNTPDGKISPPEESRGSSMSVWTKKGWVEDQLLEKIYPAFSTKAELELWMMCNSSASPEIMKDIYKEFYEEA